MPFSRQINYSLFILLMESALGFCQNSIRAKHATRKDPNIVGFWRLNNIVLYPKQRKVSLRECLIVYIVMHRTRPD